LLLLAGAPVGHHNEIAPLDFSSTGRWSKTNGGVSRHPDPNPQLSAKRTLPTNTALPVATVDHAIPSPSNIR
jgi:hypothetical protein